jgi:predicted nucleic acid-binding protein
MIVVSDTSPITALMSVGQAELLRELFDKVVIPPAVLRELTRTHPALPQWLQTRTLVSANHADRLSAELDAGEAEAIALAAEIKADRLLIDERRGRRIAEREGVHVIGLLGVVLLAKRRGLVPNARALLDDLTRDAGVYLNEDLIERALRAVGE